MQSGANPSPNPFISSGFKVECYNSEVCYTLLNDQSAKAHSICRESI